MYVGLVNAAIIVSGKTYDPKVYLGNEVSDVYVLATCYSSSTLSKYTNSVAGGSYGIGFNSTECSSTDRLTISFSKGTRYGTLFDYIINTKSINVLTDSFVIENLVLDQTQTTPSGGSHGGGSTRYYQCGNGLCDSGESTETCPQDCVKTQINEVTPTPTTSEETVELTPETTQETTPTKGFFPTITGAVTGALGTVGTTVAMVFIVGIAVLAVSVSVVRIRRNNARKALKK